MVCVATPVQAGLIFTEFDIVASQTTRQPLTWKNIDSLPGGNYSKPII